MPFENPTSWPSAFHAGVSQPPQSALHAGALQPPQSALHAGALQPPQSAFHAGVSQPPQSALHAGALQPPQSAFHAGVSQPPQSALHAGALQPPQSALHAGAPQPLTSYPPPPPHTHAFAIQESQLERGLVPALLFGPGATRCAARRPRARPVPPGPHLFEHPSQGLCRPPRRPPPAGQARPLRSQMVWPRTAGLTGPIRYTRPPAHRPRPPPPPPRGHLGDSCAGVRADVGAVTEGGRARE